MDFKKTERGFAFGCFLDAKGVECSIQDSSLASQAAIWLGVRDANPQKLGPNGWEAVPDPVQPIPIEGYPGLTHDILFTTRMHLGIKGVKYLRTRFKKFLDDKEFKPSSFTDLYMEQCSINIVGDCLKVGCDDAHPQICDHGWRPVPYPEGTFFTTHMFLNKEHVTELLKIFDLFLNNGYIGVYEAVN